MYSYIPLDLNQLLDVGVDLWFPICPSRPEYRRDRSEICCIYRWYFPTNEWGARGRYRDCFLKFRSIGSKRGNVKPLYLMEIKSTTATFPHFLVHHGLNTSGIALTFAVYIVYNICKRMEGAGGRGRYRDCFLQFRSIGSKCGNVNKPPYLVEIKITIGTLLHFLDDHGWDRSQNVCLSVCTLCMLCKYGL